MRSEAEFRNLATRVSNWGRWGGEDMLGTLNLIDEAAVLRGISAVADGVCYTLGLDVDGEGPQGFYPFRSNPRHVMTLDASFEHTGASADEQLSADAVAAIEEMFSLGPMRFTDDRIEMALQSSSQWDALAHIYYDGKLYNGVPSTAVSSNGAAKLGIEVVARHGVTTRAVVLDIARMLAVDVVPEERPITPDDLAAAVNQAGATLEPGDILLLRTGWVGQFKRLGIRDPAGGGLTVECAEWLHAHDVAAIAADNVGVETTLQQFDTVFSPLHLLCLRDMGLPFGELWDLDELAAACAIDGRYTCLLVAPPLKVTGGVGSPVNAVAIR